MTKKQAMREFVLEMLYRNENGLWFFKMPGRDAYVSMPGWMNARCELLFSEYLTAKETEQ